MQRNHVFLNVADTDWSIRNGDIECRLAFAGGQLAWSLVADGGRTIGPSGMPNIAIDGRAVAWTDPIDVRAIIHDHGRRELRVEVATGDGRAHLIRSFEVFPGAPFVRLSGAVENRGDSAFTITDSEILNITTPAPEPPTLFHVEQFSWVYRRDFFTPNQVRLVTGRAPTEIRMGSFPSHFSAPTSCAWFAVRGGPPDQPGAEPCVDAGLVAGIEFNGKSRLRAWVAQETAHLVSMIDDIAHVVAPGECFEVPAAFAGLFEGDWDEAGYVTQRFAEAYVHPPRPDERYPWVQYNSWRYEQDIYAEQQLEAIERCAAIGVEVVVMDLGWAVQIGEWRHDPAKFPNGLRPLADRAHELGLKFGVHLAFAQANVAAPAAKAHPDWLIHYDDDYFGAAPLCLGHRPCREWLIGEIVHLIDAYQIDYIVQDGEDMVKACSKSTHTHAPGNSNYANSTQGLDEVISTVRRLRPNLIWENCEDGGCMMTYRMARLCHSSITVDNIATYATRQGIYGASYPFSPRYSVRYMQDDPTPYTLRSAIFGGPLILMQRITEWSPEQMAETRAAIAQYKELRTLVRDAKIIHLLPPRYNVEGIGWGWDAIQAVASDRSRSVVMVYRATGETPTKTIRPRGLDGDRAYRVALQDAGRTIERTGTALATDGIEIALPELSSEIMRIERL